MTLRVDRVGMVYGKLVVEKFAYREGKHAYWKCLCSCGRYTVVNGSNLQQGKTKSCGCNIGPACSAANLRHGHARRGKRTSTHAVWWAMLQRCTNQACTRYADYGGRGIRVCARWMKFENFLEDMGERPTSLTLDRRNNDKGYNKRNCRWATRQQQSLNQRPRRLKHM